MGRKKKQEDDDGGRMDTEKQLVITFVLKNKNVRNYISLI